MTNTITVTSHGGIRFPLRYLPLLEAALEALESHAPADDLGFLAGDVAEALAQAGEVGDVPIPTLRAMRELLPVAAAAMV